MQRNCTPFSNLAHFEVDEESPLGRLDHWRGTAENFGYLNDCTEESAWQLEKVNKNND